MALHKSGSRHGTRGSRKSFLKGFGLAVVLIVVAVFGTTGCDKFTEPFKDAPRSGNDSGEPMDVIRMSDGFSNVGTSCDKHGNRIYVAYHGDNAYASIFVLPNAEGC